MAEAAEQDKHNPAFLRPLQLCRPSVCHTFLEVIVMRRGGARDPRRSGGRTLEAGPNGVSMHAAGPSPSWSSPRLLLPNLDRRCQRRSRSCAASQAPSVSCRAWGRSGSASRRSSIFFTGAVCSSRRSCYALERLCFHVLGVTNLR
jgi:hypothetical protein